MTIREESGRILGEHHDTGDCRTEMSVLLGRLLDGERVKILENCLLLKTLCGTPDDMKFWLEVIGKQSKGFTAVLRKVFLSSEAIDYWVFDDLKDIV